MTTQKSEAMIRRDQQEMDQVLGEPGNSILAIYQNNATYQPTADAPDFGDYLSNVFRRRFAALD